MMIPYSFTLIEDPAGDICLNLVTSETLKTIIECEQSQLSYCDYIDVISNNIKGTVVISSPDKTLPTTQVIVKIKDMAATYPKILSSFSFEIRDKS